MRKIFAAGLISLLPLAAPHGALAQEADATPSVNLPEAEVTKVMSAAVNGFIRPGYDALQVSASNMADKARTLCQSPSVANLNAVKTAFRELVVRWSHIEIVRVGPIIEQNRFERILFYPDRKSTGLKQVQAALAKSDETATDPATLATKSVATQGLGAIEYLIYGTDADKDILGAAQNYRCRYTAAAAQNVSNVAAEIAGIWDDPSGIQKAWEQPGPDNPNFRNGGEAITALLGILVHGTEAVRDQRIETFYKGTDKAKFPKQALFWRSHNTWNSVQGNLEGLSKLLETSGMVALLQEKDRPVVAATEQRLKSLISTSRTIVDNIERAVEIPGETKKLDTMLAGTKDVIAKLNDGYGGAIGLSSGFSFADGD